MTDDADDTLEAKIAAIEAAFAGRVPATLSILLEEAAVYCERHGPAGAAAALRSASRAAYRRQDGEARALLDGAVRELRRPR